MRAHVEGERGEPGSHLFDLQWLVAGLHIELQESPSAPSQGHELARMTSARQKFILKSYDVLPRNLVSIALFTAIIDERFRVCQLDRRTLSATYGERRIGSGQL